MKAISQSNTKFTVLKNANNLKSDFVRITNRINSQINDSAKRMNSDSASVFISYKKGINLLCRF